MARYIDVEKVNLKGIAVFDENLELLIPLSDVRKALQMTPTVDVVPKSEVEELKAIIADHKANEEQWQELYADTVDKWEKAYEELEIKFENANTEVAREIFEKIESLLYLNQLQGDIFVGKYFDADLENDIAELKKKYTEV